MDPDSIEACVSGMTMIAQNLIEPDADMCQNSSRLNQVKSCPVQIQHDCIAGQQLKKEPHLESHVAHVGITVGGKRLNVSAFTVEFSLAESDHFLLLCPPARRFCVSLDEDFSRC